MTVERILGGKGSHVETIEPGQPLSEAARQLSAKRIGALVVSDSGTHVLGILSERDIVRAVAAGGAAALDEPIANYMTSKVVTCTMRSPINEVMGTMTQGKFRHLPVLEDGTLVGIVSIGDIVKHRVAEIEAESQALRDYIATA